MRLEMQVQDSRLPTADGVLGSGDRHTFEAVMFVSVCGLAAVVNGPVVV